LGHDEIVDSKRKKAILTNFRQPEKNCLEMGKTWRIAAIPTLCTPMLFGKISIFRLPDFRTRFPKIDNLIFKLLRLRT